MTEKGFQNGEWQSVSEQRMEVLENELLFFSKFNWNEQEY